MYLAKIKLFDAAAFKAALDGQDRPLPVFRDALNHGRQSLEQMHLAGAPSQEMVSGNAWLVDQLLHYVWAQFQDKLDPKVSLAMLAVGGYGRSELHPNSDVDLLILLAKKDHDRIRAFVEPLLSFLWDIGLEVGHSVRSIKECIIEAKKDISVATNMMEARHLEGDRELLGMMQSRTAPPKIWPVKAFFAAKWTEQIERHQRFDDTAYNLEPNIKEGPGGLRDIQMIGWVAHRQFGTSDLTALVEHGFLTDEEHRTLIRGRNFLWKLRNGLHFLAKRREDRLLFDHQRSLAEQFGYQKKEGHLAVEQLMKRYYRTVKELRLLNEILLQHFQEAVLTQDKTKQIPINRRFHNRNGFLETTNDRVFNNSPFAILEMFLLLQQHPELKGVRASTIRQLRVNLHRIDQKFRLDIACRSLFMEIMRQPTGVTHSLRRMNAYGVLGAYLPEFGRIVGQMQHDLFHVYTVDAHSLFVLRNIRRLSVAKFQEEFPLASRIMGRLFKPERLYIAALYHDVAKGRGGDHSVLGEKDALAFCRRHVMSEYDAIFISWLVRHHLLMSTTAQRHDISDPQTILKFAQIVGEQERLDNLYLLTIADIRGTSPNVWNAWKGRLLEELYINTSRTLRRGLASPLQADEKIRETQQAVIAKLSNAKRNVATIQEFWTTFDTDYFYRHDIDSIAWQTQAIVNTPAIMLPLVSVRYDKTIDANQFLIFAPETDTLLPAVAGAFDRLSLNIADARIHATRAGFALYVLVALGRQHRLFETANEREQLELDLRTRILNLEHSDSVVTTHVPRSLKHFPIETRVEFGSGVGNQTTVMEVSAQDRPGLLYLVARALLHCKVQLHNAKIATYGERAEDIFFITNRDGQPVNDPAQQDCLRETISKALAPSTSQQTKTKAAKVELR